MADALDLLQNLEKMDLERVVGEALQENAELIADMNAAQMSQGFRSDGSEILPSYSPLTVEIKKAKGQIHEFVTLRDTGQFQARLYAQVKGKEIEYGSRDEKSESLDKKYSTKNGSIFGLMDDYREEFAEGHLRRSLFEKIKNETGL